VLGVEEELEVEEGEVDIEDAGWPVEVGVGVGRRDG
jgi:hypothetical protein